MRHPLIALSVVVGLGPSLASAQLLPPLPAPVPSPPPRHTASVAGVYAQPLGEFGENVKRGFGADGSAAYGIDSRGIVSVRAYGGYIQYNSKTQPFRANTQFGVVDLESQTKSGVLMAGAGPQLMAPTGRVRPYVAGTIGFARFATSTSINIPARYSSSGQTETIDSQTISSDFIRSLGASAGVAFSVPFLGRTGPLADIGVRYHRNGLARYVSSEGVQYNGSATPTVTATESEADFLVYRIGLLIALR